MHGPHQVAQILTSVTGCRAAPPIRAESPASVATANAGAASPTSGGRYASGTVSALLQAAVVQASVNASRRWRMIVPVLAPCGAGLALVRKSTVDGRLLPAEANETLPDVPLQRCARFERQDTRSAIGPESRSSAPLHSVEPGSLTRQRCDDQDGRHNQDDGRQCQFDQE